VDANEKPAQVRAVCIAYAVTGGICLTIACLGLLPGLFTGPHVLIPALGFIVIGAASVAVGCGDAAG